MKNWRVKNLPKKLKGKDNPHWKGGIHYRKDGYILVRKGIFKKTDTGTKYILQHRLVVEKFMGKKLLRNQIVHHINGIKSDNRIENLKVMTQSEHAKQDYLLRKKDSFGRLK